MGLEDTVYQILEKTLIDSGFEIVRVQIRGDKRKTVQIMIERVDGVGVSLDDCVTVSRLSSVLLDVDDPIPGSYTLEVSSAGLDRPLVKLKDFERFVGSLVKIELKVPIDGMRRFRARLQGVEGDKISFSPEAEGESHFQIGQVDFSDIQKAKIIPE